MSVYRDTEATVVFEHPHDGPLTAVVYREGEILPVYTPSEAIERSDGGKFTLALPWQVTGSDGKLTIAWSADGFVRKQTVEVVTPIVPLARLRALFEDENKTDEELAELEKTVRVVVEAYTGQSFGYSIGARVVTTSGGRAILPVRIESIASVGGGDLGLTLKPGEDGFTLYAIPNSAAVLTTEEEASELDRSLVIYAPGTGAVRSVRDATFAVAGAWGYNEVPAEVQEAALLLANDYITGDSGYRDRYLSILKIQQDSFTYHPGAFRGTGNARADLLLGPYRRSTRMLLL